MNTNLLFNHKELGILWTLFNFFHINDHLQKSLSSKHKITGVELLFPSKFNDAIKTSDCACKHGN